MTAPEGVGGPGSVRVASLADAGSARLLFQHDDTFWYELVRSFGTGEYGVSLFAEVLAIASTIQEGDFESWYAPLTRRRIASPTKPRRDSNVDTT